MPQTNLFLAAELFEFLMCLCINSLSDVCLANFQHVNCLSPQSVVQRLFGLLLPGSSTYAFIVCAFGSIPKYFRQDQCQEVFPTCFLRVIFHLLFFHWSLSAIFIYDAVEFHCIACGYPILQHHLWGRLSSSPLCVLGIFLKDQLAIDLWFVACLCQHHTVLIAL